MPDRLPAIGFWSYARRDDALSGGGLSRLRALVQSELQQQLGREPIQLFQDSSAIPLGSQWESEIRHSLGNATFFIPILTPNFLQSEWCCREVRIFLDRQQEIEKTYPGLPRRSRIFPIHYIDIDECDAVDETVRDSLMALQRLDFLDLRHESPEDKLVRRTLSGFARELRNLLRLPIELPTATKILPKQLVEPEELRSVPSSEPAILRGTEAVPEESDFRPLKRDMPGLSPPKPVPASISEQLRKSGRHPVLVFGAACSGKTMLLMSLLQCLMRDPHTDVRLGDPILDQADPHYLQQKDLAIRFFEGNWVDELSLPSATIVDRPFFIPIDICSRDAGHPVRLALLEGRGEWYEPRDDGGGSIYRNPPEDIVDILQHYDAGISVLYLAAYSIGDEGEHDTMTSDQSLVGAIRSYKKYRHRTADDHHMAVMTKWDIAINPLMDDPQFDVASQVLVDELLTDRYPWFWPEFQSMALAQGMGGRASTIYSAGPIINGIVRHPPVRHIETFSRFPKVILNWLYGNAAQISMTVEGKTIQARQILYPEVVQNTKSARLVDRLRWLFR